VFVDFLLSFVILRQFFFALLKLLDIYYSVSRVLLRPLGGVILMTVILMTVRGSNSWTGNVFPNRSSDFCPRMAKRGVC
jgi:hypothetical protein